MQPSGGFACRQIASFVKLDELLRGSGTTPGKIYVHTYSIVRFWGAEWEQISIVRTPSILWQTDFSWSFTTL